jgi:hypothetical protein
MSENNKDIKMKFVKIGILILVGLDIIFACSPVNIKNLTYYKRSADSNFSFRMDGYYYNKNCDSTNQQSYAYFFYPDGFLIRSNNFQNNPLTILDAKLDTFFNKGSQERKEVHHRGAFKTVNDSVKIEVFQCYFNCNIVNVSGKIINDSTLLFIGKTVGKHGRIYHQNSVFCDTFHFRKLDWKPDSTYQIGFDKELKKHKYKF